MTNNGAREYLVLSSLVITGVQSLFLVVAPAIGFPLRYPDNMHMLEIISPVFLGYLGSATHFIFSGNTMHESSKKSNDLLGYIVVGPIVIYGIVTIGAFSAFGFLNRSGSAIGSGMLPENLATALSASLGVLAVTTGIITSRLFSSGRDDG